MKIMMTESTTTTALNYGDLKILKETNSYDTSMEILGYATESYCG
jgi:hypothetical protein